MDLSANYIEVADKLVILTGVESFAQHFRKAAELALMILPAVEIARREFLSICTGTRPDSPFNESICFPKRFLGGTWKSQDIAESCSKSIQEIFDCGFIVHFAFTEFPTRKHVNSVEPEKFSDKWLPESLLAVIKMRDYSIKVIPHVPIEGLIEGWFEHELRELIKSTWKIGLLKRMAVRSYFRATFFTGVALAFEYDLETRAAQ